VILTGDRLRGPQMVPERPGGVFRVEEILESGKMALRAVLRPHEITTANEQLERASLRKQYSLLYC
jgi:hypothetical protein